jgi:hypothetical protein
VLQWIKRGVRRALRALFNWTSLLAIPCGLLIGYNGHRTLGALLILGGTLAYFLVDPILMLLDLVRSVRPDPDRGWPQS